MLLGIAHEDTHGSKASWMFPTSCFPVMTITS